MANQTPNEADAALEAIKEEVLNLTQSPLYEYRTSNSYFPVLGEGSHTADIVFVGEAPGETEAKTARPFCGRSGKFLDEMLASIGLIRENVYITNLVKDRPPKNRDPQPEEIALYAPFLDRQLAAIRPKVVVTLGRLSMAYIMNTYGCGEHLQTISKIHGQVFKGKAPHGPIDIVTLYHPAVALYSGNMRVELLKDFEVLKSYIG